MSRRLLHFLTIAKLPETMGEVRVATIHETELRDLDHPNIVGTCKMGFAAGRRGEQPTHVAMMMDVIARSGTDFMKSKKRVEQALTPEEFKCIAYQLIRAIAFCHSRYVANYDIKPGNVLIGGMRRSGAGDEPGSVLPRVWLSDFGLSGGYEFGARAVPRRGTSQYQPPEWIFMDARDESIEMIGTAVDAWGLACTLYALATGHSLFTGKAGRGSYSVSAHRSQIVSLIGPVPEELKETWYAKYGSMSIGNPAKVRLLFCSGAHLFRKKGSRLVQSQSGRRARKAGVYSRAR